MDKAVLELKKIFKKLLEDINLKPQEVEAITTLVRTPMEMAKIVDVIEQNPEITYPELFEAAMNIIDFEIEIK